MGKNAENRAKEKAQQKEKKQKISLQQRGASFLKSRKFKYGSVATGLTVAFVAVVIILNIIFSLLADTYSWKIDLTSYDLYSITDTTREIVNSLTEGEKIEMTVMYNEEEYPQQFRETLKRINNLSERVDIKYVDPDVNPQILTSFGTEFSIDEGAVVVKNKDRIRVVAFNDMVESDSSSGAVTYKIEEALSAAMLYVTKEEVPLIYFVTGHGETGYEAFMNLLANNGAEVEEVKLNQLTTFDEMARVMVICGPAMDYSEVEIRKVQDFLANDYNYERDLFYFSNPESPDLPNLDAFLSEWGIVINDDLVLETDNYSASTYATPAEAAPLYLIPGYAEADIDGIKIEANYLSVVPATSSITLLFEQSDLTGTAPLLTTSDGSYAKNVDAVNSYEKAEGDKAGPFTIAAVATRARYQDNVELCSHIFVAGSVKMLNATHMNFNGNSNYLFEIYKAMVGEDELTEMMGASKTANNNVMTLDTAAIRVGSIVFIGVIPGIFLLIGVLVFIRRRYL